MFLVVPIGHDQSLRRFPWVTVGIGAACVFMQIQSCRSSVDGEALVRLVGEQQQLAREHVLRELLGSTPGAMKGDEARDPEAGEPEPGGPPDPSALAERLDKLRKLRPRDYAEKQRDFAAGRDVDPNDPDRVRYLALEREIDRLLRKDPAHRWAYRPADGISINILLSGFVHGGWLHLVGNLLFLWLVGCNLEDRWGRAAFAAVYLAGIVAANLTYRMWHPDGTVAAIGASGAISAAMGAFLINFHDAEIRFWYVWLIRMHAGTFEAKAMFVMPWWFLKDLAHSYFEAHGLGGVAYSAHVGGFLFGVGVALALRLGGIEKRYLLPAVAKGVEWEEDPELVEAIDRRAAGHADQAVALLRAVLARKPSHATAPIELCRCGLALDDRALVEESLPRAIASLARAGADQEIVLLYRDVEAKWRLFVAPERTLAEMARAANQSGYFDVARRLLNRLLVEFPGGPLAPRALWDLATLDEEQGRLAEARAALARLLEEHPMHALAEEARRKDAELATRALPPTAADLDGRLSIAGPEATPAASDVERSLPSKKRPAPASPPAPLAGDEPPPATAPPTRRREIEVEAESGPSLELDLPPRRR